MEDKLEIIMSVLEVIVREHKTVCEINEVIEAKTIAVRNNDFELASKHREKELQLRHLLPKKDSYEKLLNLFGQINEPESDSALLIEAGKKYPINCDFKCVLTNEITKCTIKPYWYSSIKFGRGISVNNGGGSVYSYGKWADIVDTKESI